MDIYMCVCVCICGYVDMYVYIYMCVCGYVYIYIFIYMCVDMCIYMTYSQTYMQVTDKVQYLQKEAKLQRGLEQCLADTVCISQENFHKCLTYAFLEGLSLQMISESSKWSATQTTSQSKVTK